ncbi:L-alanine-DL-glutamate epimerase [Halogranum amylolyticum]|uniref:o-succinylbenzoate synthase n=1 Tax=Halogranum amylolyticum TaxID=660520 RepID=A0A1H8ST75_9EURY|nr:o-succinylbenzoate synthase [Halogranum amylolyticum]SEO81373.1 L-alanine-DL-glutamate epimerase [Halogranum amylolyticum]
MDALDLREFALDLRTPLGTAKGEITERRGLLVGVERERADGSRVRGVGEAAPLTPWTESYDDCAASLRALSEEEDRDEGGDGDEDHTGDSGGLLDGLGPAARHGVTLAATDAAARAADVPLAEYLATPAATDDPAEIVPVNGTVGDGSVEETVTAAEAAVTDGFDCLKLKVGARDVDADLDRLRAVREAVGDEVTLRADANGAWTREEADRVVDVLATLDFAYVEQPLAADDLAGHADLRGRGVDVALDESINGASESEWPRPIADYADVIVLKPMAQGGPRATVELARHLRSQGVTPVVTTTVDAVVARTAAVHVAAAVPDVPACGLATADLLADDLADDPCPVVDGSVSVPQGPGLAGDAFDSLLRRE